MPVPVKNVQRPDLTNSVSHIPQISPTSHRKTFARQTSTPPVSFGQQPGYKLSSSLSSSTPGVRAPSSVNSLSYHGPKRKTSMSNIKSSASTDALPFQLQRDPEVLSTASTPPRQSNSGSASLPVASSPAISLTSPSPRAKLKLHTPSSSQRSHKSSNPNLSTAKLTNGHSTSTRMSSTGPKSQVIKYNSSGGASSFAGPVAAWSPPAMLSEQAPALLSESRALLDSQLSDKDLFIAQQEEDNPFSVWDGDDMTMEMLTDANDGDVDEEACPILFFKSLRSHH